MFALIIDGGTYDDHAILFDTMEEAWAWADARPWLNDHRVIAIINKDTLHRDRCECEVCVRCAECEKTSCDCGGSL